MVETGPGFPHLQGPGGEHQLKAEEVQQEAEAAGEKAGVEWALRYQQQMEGKGAQEAPGPPTGKCFQQYWFR